MESNGRLLLKKQPKSNSFILSFFGYALFLMIAMSISYKYSKPKSEIALSKSEKKIILRQKSQQFSLSRFSSGLPNTPLILGIYQNGNDAFYHQFKDLAESYTNINNVSFALVNIKISEELAVLEGMGNKNVFQDFSLDDVPTVMFIYQNKEWEKLRMSLRFTNLGDQELKKRVEGLINISLQPSKNP